MRTLKILVVMTLVLLVGSDAFAQRRAGLGGKYSARYMTAAKGSIFIIAGPKSSQALGTGGDAGLQFTHIEPSLDLPDGIDAPDIDYPTSMDFNFGAAYGITPNIEAGLFLPLHLTTLGLPEGAEDNKDAISVIPLFVSYGKVVGGNTDIGARVTANIPICDGCNFGLTPGIPVNMRTGNGRLEAGLFLPLNFPEEIEGVDGSGDMQIGLNIPVRYSMSFTPNLFAGLETGFKKGDLSNGENDLAIPLGLFGGYTVLAGGSVIDIVGEFTWDQFLQLDAPEGLNALQASTWRFGIGANIQMSLGGG